MWTLVGARMLAFGSRGLRVSTFRRMHDGHAREGVSTYHLTTRRSRADKLPRSRGCARLARFDTENSVNQRMSVEKPREK
ncbi:hypothetical protein CRG98_017857 [Punica granatum]|uniref:Uncharacterized protein n=1 Tax=Punica granatum TaxID=22663 RepID=A0A2I0JZL2_PUNGR|nr:hypothetical protein CRG98_017857 [Punica granatum]